MILSLAGLNVEVNARYPYTADLAREYLSDSSRIDFSVFADDDDIKAEADASELEYSRGYLESIAIYRKIAEKLPMYDAVVFHGAVIACEGKAYAFTARSGVGKTTHLRLWLEAFGEKVHILNGDKPILRVIDGMVYAAGTPWRGKESYGIPEMLPLAAVAFLERAEQPSAREINASDAIARFASQIYIPRDAHSAVLSLSVLNKLICGTSLYEVRANMDISSALVAYGTLIDKKYI